MWGFLGEAQHKPLPEDLLLEQQWPLTKWGLDFKELIVHFFRIYILRLRKYYLSPSWVSNNFLLLKIIYYTMYLNEIQNDHPIAVSGAKHGESFYPSILDGET